MMLFKTHRTYTQNLLKYLAIEFEIKLMEKMVFPKDLHTILICKNMCRSKRCNNIKLNVNFI